VTVGTQLPDALRERVDTPVTAALKVTVTNDAAILVEPVVGPEIALTSKGAGRQDQL
jgi:hypothetical protein